MICAAPRGQEGAASRAVTCLKILKSSSISESPGKSALWFIISTKMQPIDQTSTGVE